MAGIDKRIKTSEDIDLSGEDIHRITDGKANIIEYEQLEEYNSIDDVLGEFGAVIILYETKKNFGHWVGLFRTSENTIEFFDPYGLDVDEELNIEPQYNMRRHNGNLEPHLTVLIKTSGYRVVSNSKRLQKVLEHVNTCGRWVSLRIRFRDVGLKKFIDLFTKNECYDGDFWVSALTLFV